MALENISRPIMLYRFVGIRAWYPLFVHALDLNSEITGSSPCVIMSLRVYICMLIVHAPLTMYPHGFYAQFKHHYKQWTPGTVLPS